MKTLDFLDRLQAECLDLGLCGMTYFYADNEKPAESFFKAYYEDGKRTLNKPIFYFYGPIDFTFGFLPTADSFLSVMDSDEYIFIWELED